MSKLVPQLFNSRSEPKEMQHWAVCMNKHHRDSNGLPDRSKKKKKIGGPDTV